VYWAVNPESSTDVFVLNPDGERHHFLGQGGGSAASGDEQWLAICTWPKGIVVGRLPDFSSITPAVVDGCAPGWGPGNSSLYYEAGAQLVLVQKPQVIELFGTNDLVKG
jgi:hypothetical protein